ncbi:MAG TPA: formyltransferase family protein [Bacteroidia bacterium]|nr:formyltransferase family protein [Bacteroidia bacterium]
MRIFIITMEDPVYTLPFIRAIIDGRRQDIVGVATTKGDRLTIGKSRSQLMYLFSLLLIMGVPAFLRYSWTTVVFKLKKKLSGKFSFIPSPSILTYAKSSGIEVFDITTPNSKAFREILKELKPDVIINQSQSIIKKELLEIPAIGVINRHNALLPKNRGRLTPFWVLFRKEKETGVSIHFVEEGIDSGDIIVQERYAVSSRDTFNTLVQKNYEIAPHAMLKALSLLESGNPVLLPNDDLEASYNTVPTFREAMQYRMNRLLGRK